jgi:hypothetical protein
MFSLTYVSSANRRYSNEELERLASVCIENNQRTELTGVLLYRGGNFMQVLEGEEAQVRKLYSVIGCDTRHRGLITLLQGPIDKRHFPQWAMRVEILSDLPGGIGQSPPFFKTMFDNTSPLVKPPPAQTLLMKFAEQR